MNKDKKCMNNYFKVMGAVGFSVLQIPIFLLVYHFWKMAMSRHSLAAIAASLLIMGGGSIPYVVLMFLKEIGEGKL